MENINKELFVVGVCDIKSGYKRIHHLDEIKYAKVTYDALCKGAKSQGLDPNSIFIFPFPPDDEVVEKFKLTKSFLQWLNEEVKLIMTL